MDVFEIIRKTMSEFKEVDDDTVRVFISLAEPLISKKKFGKLYQQALAYLAAHTMKISNNQAGNTATDAEFGLTVYGMQYIQLRKRCIVPFVSAGADYGG